MHPSCVESLIPEPLQLHIQHVSPKTERKSDCLDRLRSVQWRINLGILPSFTLSIDDLRRATAEYRRRYAHLRRKLLTNPHVPKDDETATPNLIMDNPLSQNPESRWGRFFQSAELEKMVDQDLSRLYPHHEPYFHTPTCLCLLRRILLLWCLAHPHFGYRQGMHELLAPLLYVLHTDVSRLSEVRRDYGAHFPDEFDAFSPLREDDFQYEPGRHGFRGEPDPEIWTFVLLGDAYGPEGALGAVLSDAFMEHDAYCMFDALLSGSVADFFSSPGAGLPPVIEASLALYRLLSAADPPLYTHLIALGVEPQYFALRWLRLLFGREFSLSDLLVVWDEILSADDAVMPGSGLGGAGDGFLGFGSGRGALIAGVAVAMILNLRSALLASDNATTCLQRLLNFPGKIDLERLLETAKGLRGVEIEPGPGPSGCSPGGDSGRRGERTCQASSPHTGLGTIPESYWEEQWKVFQEEELRRGSPGKKKTTPRRRRWAEIVRPSLSRVVSDPTHLKVDCQRDDGLRSTARRNLLEDLSREAGSDEPDVAACSPEVEGGACGGSTQGVLEVGPSDGSGAPLDEADGRIDAPEGDKMDCGGAHVGNSAYERNSGLSGAPLDEMDGRIRLVSDAPVGRFLDQMDWGGAHIRKSGSERESEGSGAPLDEMDERICRAEKMDCGGAHGENPASERSSDGSGAPLEGVGGRTCHVPDTPEGCVSEQRDGGGAHVENRVAESAGQRGLQWRFPWPWKVRGLTTEKEVSPGRSADVASPPFWPVGWRR